MEDLHFPGQDLPENKPEVPETPAPEVPAPTETKKEDTPPAPVMPEPPAPAPETPKEEVPVTKPRSIYKDLKETRQEKNAWQETAVAALKAQGIELTGTETPEQVQELLAQHKTVPPAPSPTPEVPAPSPQDPPVDPIEAFAKEKGYDPAELARLAQIIKDQIPPSQLSDEERQSLTDLKAFKEKTDADTKRREEDNAIQAEEPSVQKQLNISDASELTAVMAEIVRLAHTPEYADKPVKYIVWDKQSDLSKLVSPKKPSFENGTVAPAVEAEPEVNLSNGGVTPEMAQKANQKGSRTELEHRKAQ